MGFKRDLPEIIGLIDCPNCHRERTAMMFTNMKVHCQVCGYMKTKTKEAKISKVKYKNGSGNTMLNMPGQGPHSEQLPDAEQVQEQQRTAA